MSVGYIPYVWSGFRMSRRNACAVLTERNAMLVKLGSGNMVDFEIQYKICNSVVNPSMSNDASGSGTYPNEAINKTRLDQKSEDPTKPQRPFSLTQVFPYSDAALPTPETWSEIVVGGWMQEERTMPSRQSSQWRAN